MILLDAFERTANKAVDWADEDKAVDTDQEERQTMLKVLDAFGYVSVGEA